MIFEICKNCKHCFSQKVVYEKDLKDNLMQYTTGTLNYCKIDCDDFNNPDTHCRHFNDKELD